MAGSNSEAKTHVSAFRYPDGPGKGINLLGWCAECHMPLFGDELLPLNIQVEGAIQRLEVHWSIAHKHIPEPKVTIQM